MTNKLEYRQTHPWLTFSLDLKRAPAELWLLLGECQSKCEHLARYPLRPDVAYEIHKMYMVKGALGSAGIEGNTLSEDEVKKLLDGDLVLAPSKQYLGIEVENIINECNRLLDELKARRILPLSLERLKEINRVVLNNLEVEDHVRPGEIRTDPVGVGLYKAPNAKECEFLLTELCQWLNGEEYFGTRDDPRVMVFAILKAIIAHLYFVWIHPFGDGNGRSARLIEFQILISSRIPSPAAHLLSNHYYNTRTDYYRQLHRASQSGGDVLPFVMYAVRGFVDGLKSQLEVVKQQVLDVVWQNFVLDQFLDRNTAADLRRRYLVEDLSRITEPKSLPYEQLPFVSNRVARLYANKTPRTLIRDINRLYDMRLLTFDKGNVRARKEEILAFLPVSSPLPSVEEQPKRRKRQRAHKL